MSEFKFFCVPFVPEVQYEGRTLVNNPVNLLHVTTYQRSTHSDPLFRETRPAIYFAGVDVKWVFNTPEERETEWKHLVNWFS